MPPKKRNSNCAVDDTVDKKIKSECQEGLTSVKMEDVPVVKDDVKLEVSEPAAAIKLQAPEDKIEAKVTLDILVLRDETMTQIKDNEGDNMDWDDNRYVFIDIDSIRMNYEDSPREGLPHREGLLPNVLPLKSFGFGGEYERVCRSCTARIRLDGEIVGRISYNMISRDELLGSSVSFWKICDAESGGLGLIASTFFNVPGEGKLKKRFLKAMVDNDEFGMPNYSIFIYISEITMDAGYGLDCPPEHLFVQVTALNKLMEVVSNCVANDVTATLAMCTLDGSDDLDKRALRQAGFAEAYVKSCPRLTFMFRELAYVRSEDCVV